MSNNLIYNIIANAAPLSSFLKNIIPTLVNTVALDGAADKLLEIAVNPLVVIGDLDSVSQYGLSVLKEKNIEVHHIDNQDFTDLDKAIMFCDSNHATAINIYNCLGNRLDHTLLNLRMLKRYYSSDRGITIFNDDSIIKYLTDQSIELFGTIGDDVAVMAFTEAFVTSLGLKYEMNNYELKFAYRESSSNSLNQTKAKIEVRGDAIVIFSNKLNYSVNSLI